MISHSPASAFWQDAPDVVFGRERRSGQAVSFRETYMNLYALPGWNWIRTVSDAARVAAQPADS